MAIARHPVPPEIARLSLEEIAERYIGRFRDKVADWDAFEDAKIEGYRRAQHRFIAGAARLRQGLRRPDPIYSLRGFYPFSIMFVPPGQGNAAHTHEVEEVFFVHCRAICDGSGADEDDPGASGSAGSWHPRWGVHRLPAGGHPRLPERGSGAGLYAGHARARPPRGDGLCR